MHAAAGSHHFVCCDQITTPDNPNSPHGNYNPLGRVIKSASNSSNYSWCTCSEEVRLPEHPDNFYLLLTAFAVHAAGVTQKCGPTCRSAQSNCAAALPGT
jgi:hypothetical protein